MQTESVRRAKSGKGTNKARVKTSALGNTVAAQQAGEALRRLEAGGVLTGQADKVSARIDHGLLAAAARKVGSTNTTEVVQAALAAFVAPDPFVAWFLSDKDRLPDDFELGL